MAVIIIKRINKTLTNKIICFFVGHENEEINFEHFSFKAGDFIISPVNYTTMRCKRCEKVHGNLKISINISNCTFSG